MAFAARVAPGTSFGGKKTSAEYVAHAAWSCQGSIASRYSSPITDTICRSTDGLALRNAAGGTIVPEVGLGPAGYRAGPAEMSSNDHTRSLSHLMTPSMRPTSSSSSFASDRFGT